MGSGVTATACPSWPFPSASPFEDSPCAGTLPGADRVAGETVTDVSCGVLDLVVSTVTDGSVEMTDGSVEIGTGVAATSWSNAVLEDG